ncbi:splicing factor U2af large subunit B-like [Achlya hypogyna]|uniref:Splicing factor U2af large subunit B-like n=1 Tax=Achlya hypogyna TaxID=1202772 RepID=A0A1V9ZCS5_ACHHY|nr:splicing factor U2af large subunit B-like [Achlya hypogyna]
MHARRLYIGGWDVETKEDVSSFINTTICTALGKDDGSCFVVSVYIVHERRFAYVELSSMELATACLALDGMIYRGLPLKVRRPNDYNPSAVNDMLSYSKPSFTKLAAAAEASGPIRHLPSRILVLLNVATSDALLDDAEYAAICDEVSTECAKSGPVLSVVVPRPGEARYPPTSVGKVFVEFKLVNHAEHAAKALHGRGFDDRIVAVEFMSPAIFAIPAFW